MGMIAKDRILNFLMTQRDYPLAVSVIADSLGTKTALSAVILLTGQVIRDNNLPLDMVQSNGQYQVVRQPVKPGRRHV